MEELFPSNFIALFTETFAKLAKHFVCRICFRLDPYAQFVFIRVGQCSWLLRWQVALSIIYVNEREVFTILDGSCALEIFLSFIVLVVCNR